MRRAGIKPDIKNVGDLFIVIDAVIIPEEPGIFAIEPCICAFGRNSFRNPVLHGLVPQWLTCFLADINGDRHTPGTLPRHTPVRPLLDHAAKPFLASLWHKPRFVDCRKGRITKTIGLHRNKPLRRIAEDQRRLGAPAMRITVNQLTLRQQTAGFLQHSRNLVIDLVDMLARKQRDVIIEGTVFGDRLRRLDAITAAQFPVICTMSRGDMDNPCPLLIRREVCRQGRHVEIKPLPAQRMTADGSSKRIPREFRNHRVRSHLAGGTDIRNQVLRADQLLTNQRQTTFINSINTDDDIIQLRTIGDGPVARHGPGSCRPDQD